MTEPRVVVFGEALTDLVRTGDNHWTSFAGGSCWNVARAVARLGIPAAWAGAVSADLFGREILEQSRQAGLDPRFLQVVDKPPLIAVVHQTRPPQYFFLGADSADLAFDEQRLPPGWEDSCEFAHFGCISLVREPLGSRLVRIAERLGARGIPISFDPNVRNLMGPDYSGLFEQLAKLAAVIKLSDEDLAGIYPGLPAGAAIARIRALAPKAALLFTRGAEGLRLYAGAETVEQPAFPVAIADTVGAGDCCLGAYIASSLSSPSAGAAQHARFAAAAAAVTCAHAGAYAPGREEVARMMDGT
jgi:fructokinase